MTSELRTFNAYALHQVTRFVLGDIGLWEAVQDLRTKAIQHGLVARYGRDQIEWIIGDCFDQHWVDYHFIRPLDGIYP